MEAPHIEVLGQKLSYPTTVYGCVAVLFFCIALVSVAKIAADWATPEALSEVRSLLADETAKSAEIADLNEELLYQVSELQTKLLSKPYDRNSTADPQASNDMALELDLEKLRVRREQAYLKLLEDQKVRADTAAANEDNKPELRIYSDQQQQQQQQFESQLQQIQQQQQQIQQQMQQR